MQMVGFPGDDFAEKMVWMFGGRLRLYDVKCGFSYCFGGIYCVYWSVVKEIHVL
jgi:hypothetical protein